jgi:EAL domain-containing protein (putative c-di-GMP-specific phosphodiesterase class I)
MVGAEALLRWKHPERGTNSPLDFIPIAENTMLIIPIGEWVLKEACKQLKGWHEKGYTGYSISVNVSVIQLQQSSFKDIVSNILNEAGLKPEYLEIEITESAFIESTEEVVCNLNYLREQGVKIAIDDFGTGYNSLKYLSKLVIDCLKIDKMFVSNIKTDMNKVIIDTVIALGHKINAKIIAEGVETKEQYEYLLKSGCDKIQGYYFSKPVLANEIVDFLK